MKLEITNAASLEQFPQTAEMYSVCRTLDSGGTVYILYEEMIYSGVSVSGSQKLTRTAALKKMLHNIKHMTISYCYGAVKIIPDRYSFGECFSEYIPLGEYKEHFSQIHPYKDGMLLIGRSGAENVGVIFNAEHKETGRISLGEAFADKSLVTDSNEIILGAASSEYDPMPITFYNENGFIRGIDLPPVVGITAFNIDENDNLWYYSQNRNSFFDEKGDMIKAEPEYITGFALLPHGKGIAAHTSQGLILYRRNEKRCKLTLTCGGGEVTYEQCSFCRNMGAAFGGDTIYFFEI